MTDRRRPLVWRLSLAFAAVAFGAVALFALLMIAITRADVNALGRQQEAAAVAAIRRSLESAYGESGSWNGADMAPALGTAGNAGARIQVVDAHGAEISRSEGTPVHRNLSTQSVPLVVGGTPVGTVQVQFPSSGLLPADRRLRSHLVAAAGVVGGIAALLAVVVAVIVTRRITRPLQALTGAVRAMESGDRAVRVGPVSSAAELGELAIGFDRMADTLARQDDLRQALVADVAHELRTPVAVLQATCEAVIDGVSPPTIEMVGSMHEEVLRLGKRVEDLGTLASAETAGLRLTRGAVDLSQVAEDAVAAHEQRFAAAGLTISTELTPVVVNGDQARLFQVISNLLINAAKFTPADGRVRVTVGPHSKGAMVRVADSGVGIPPDELGHVFERFWRGRASAGREGGGIGLAIVAELVRAHHGTVHVDSVPDEGSVFTVCLPLAQRASSTPADGRPLNARRTAGAG
jgi:two-component system, OmpR family, sensor histidine kinase BaeS